MESGKAESSWTLHPDFPDFSSAEGALADLKDGIGCPEEKTEEVNVKLFFLLISCELDGNVNSIE